MALRDIKRQARRDLHALMEVPAYYVRVPSAAPVAAHVRIHNHFNQVGDIKGSRTYPAEAENVSPKIIFQLSEVPLLRSGAIVSVSATEAYQIDHLIDADDEFQSAWATRMTAAQISAATPSLPVPDFL
jgi:hypothetical protein